MSYVFYFFGLSLLISGVGIISGNESDITIIIGAVSLSLGFYLIYVGGKVDDWKKFNTGRTLGTTPRPME